VQQEGETVTKEQMESYRSKKAEITELTYKVQHLGDNDAMVGNDVIMDYRSGYPVPQSVVGVDLDKYHRLKARYKNRIAKLAEECEQIETYIEDIEDSITRRIFRMYYIDGLSQKCVAKAVSLDRSSVSRKIDQFFKVAHNSQNAPL
jgi:hypothetical protein